MTVESAEERLQLAIREVRAKRLGVNESARAFNVPASTLKLRLRGGRSRSEARVGKHRLSREEEEALIEHVLSMDSRGFPLTYKLVKQAADDILDAKKLQPVGARWASNFVRRVEILKSGWTRGLEHKRAVCCNAQTLKNWFDLFAAILEQHNIRDCDVYNMDETGFQIGMSQSTLVVISAERQKGVKITASQREWVSVIACIAGDGYSVPPMVLVKGKSINSAWIANAPDNWAIKNSRKGWTDNITALQWLKHFDHHTESRAGGRRRLLIVDGHGSHTTKAFKDYCEDHNIGFACLPPHTSHLTQPLDVGVFSSLKHFYALEVDCEHRSGEHTIFKKSFFTALSNAYLKAMRKENIEGAFRGAGLMPLNREVVLSKIPVCRTPSPSPEPEEWHSQTPKNPLDFHKQTTLVRSYIRGHRDSSPGYIEEAITKFDKSFRIQHARQSILRGDLADTEQRYRDANRERGVRIPGSEPITAREAALLAEIARLRAQVRLGNQEKRRCGVCGERGHNARTCDRSLLLEETSLEDTTCSIIELDSSSSIQSDMLERLDSSPPPGSSFL